MERQWLTGDEDREKQEVVDSKGFYKSPDLLAVSCSILIFSSSAFLVEVQWNDATLRTYGTRVGGRGLTGLRWYTS
jgi:hypothetical protein